METVERRRSIYAPQPAHGFRYLSIEQIRKHNADIGQHWFSPKTLRFFESRILDELHLGAFFISSEKDNYARHAVRLYTVRIAKGCGCVDTVGQFQQYATLAQARKALRALTENDLAVLRECASHGMTADDYNMSKAAPAVIEMGQMMGQSELARRYGVTPSVIANWESRYSDFPRPAKLLQLRKRSHRALWLVSECDEWVRGHRQYLISRLPFVPDDHQLD